MWLMIDFSGAGTVPIILTPCPYDPITVGVAVDGLIILTPCPYDPISVGVAVDGLIILTPCPYDPITVGVAVDGLITLTPCPYDPITGAGTVPITVGVAVDGLIIFAALANASRPDLVKNHAAPDPNHGLVAEVPARVASKAGIAKRSEGNHTVTLHAWRWNDHGRTQGPVPFGKASESHSVPSRSFGFQNGPAIQICNIF